ncbi:MAG TPA: hypothetical protein VKB47_08710 [Terracidiphilus sp.]|nr:hypothetical protein [Terracidiphilus sp.]
MGAEWFTAGIAAIGILGQLYLGGRNAGRRDEKIEELGEAHLRLAQKVDEHDKLLTKHQSHLASIAGKCAVLFGPEKWGQNGG